MPGIWATDPHKHLILVGEVRADVALALAAVLCTNDDIDKSLHTDRIKTETRNGASEHSGWR